MPNMLRQRAAQGVRLRASRRMHDRKVAGGNRVLCGMRRLQGRPLTNGRFDCFQVGHTDQGDAEPKSGRREVGERFWMAGGCRSKHQRMVVGIEKQIPDRAGRQAGPKENTRDAFARCSSRSMMVNLPPRRLSLAGERAARKRPAYCSGAGSPPSPGIGGRVCRIVNTR